MYIFCFSSTLKSRTPFFNWMTLQGLVAPCARQDGDIPTIPTFIYVSYPYLNSHSVIALYLSHTENYIEKIRLLRVK